MTLAFSRETLEIFPHRQDVAAERQLELARLAKAMQTILPAPDTTTLLDRKQFISTPPASSMIGDIGPFQVKLSRSKQRPLADLVILSAGASPIGSYFVEVATTSDGSSRLYVPSFRDLNQRLADLDAVVFDEGIARLDCMLGNVAVANDIDPVSVGLKPQAQ